MQQHITIPNPITSTIWQEDSDTRVIWITMLGWAEKSKIDAAVCRIADIAGVSPDKCMAAIEKFISLRMIEQCKDGRWKILVDLRAVQLRKNAERQRRFRERRRLANSLTPTV